VALSHYNWQRKRLEIDDQFPLDPYISRFIAGDIAGWGSWGEHVLSWLATRHDSPDFLLLRYEGMLAEPGRELAKVATFLGIEATAEKLATAVERSSASYGNGKGQSGNGWRLKETRPYRCGGKSRGGWQSCEVPLTRLNQHGVR
jgi:hypothetical protein